MALHQASTRKRTHAEKPSVESSHHATVAYSHLPDIAEVLLELSHGLSLLRHLILHTPQSVCASWVRNDVEHRSDGLRRRQHGRSHVDNCLSRCVALVESTHHGQLLSLCLSNLVGLQEHTESRLSLRRGVQMVYVCKREVWGQSRACSQKKPACFEIERCAEIFACECSERSHGMKALPVCQRAFAACHRMSLDPHNPGKARWDLRTASAPKCHVITKSSINLPHLPLAFMCMIQW
jgi:hypothetical protein